MKLSNHILRVNTKCFYVELAEYRAPGKELTAGTRRK